MARGEVGSLSVRVRPDTKGFKSELRKALEKIERQVKATVEVDLSVSKASVAGLKKQLSGVSASIGADLDDADVRGELSRLRQQTKKSPAAEVPVALSDVDKAFVSRVSKQAKAAVAGVEAKIPATVEGEQLRAKLTTELAALQKAVKATVPVEPEKAAEWRAELQGMVESIKSMDAEIPVKADLDANLFRVQLAALLRPRELPIVAKVTASSAGMLAAFSGLATMRRMADEFTDSIMRIDQTMPRLARNMTLFSTVAASGLAGMSNLLGIGSGIVGMVPALLTLPAIGAAAAVSMGVLKVALQDAGTVLGDLKPQFDALGDSISAGFWSTAEAGVRSFVAAIMPLATQYLPQIGAALGTWAQSIAAAFTLPAGAAAFEAFLSNLQVALASAATGIGSLTQGLLTLVGAGSTYLPQLAGWFNDITASFAAWAEQAVNSGQFFAWVDAAIVNMQAFGSIIGSTFGIFSSLTQAATAAGAVTLPQLAAGFAAVDAALAGPVWQGALVTIFTGAHTAMQNLVPAVGALGAAFIALAPLMARLMDLGSQIANVMLVALANAVQNPVFQTGLTAFFEGALAGATQFAAVLPMLAEKLGHVFALAGTVAEVFGGVLRVAFEAFSPIIPALTGALQALIPVLGAGLVAAIQMVAPVVVQITTAISAWVQQNPQLAATIGLVVAGAGALVMGLMSVVSALAPLVSGVIGVVSGLAAMGVSVSAVTTAIVGMLGPVALVVAGIAALVAGFAVAWSTSEQFRAGIVALGASVVAALQPMVNVFLTQVLPAIQQVIGAFVQMAAQIGGALASMLGAVANFVGAFIQFWSPLIGLLAGQVGPAFTFLGGVVSATFSLIGSVVSTQIAFITGILNTFAALLRGDWTAAWQSVQQTASAVMAGLGQIFSAGLQLVSSIVTGFVTMVVAQWGTFWTTISTAASTALTAVVGFFTSKFTEAKTVVTNFTTQVKSSWDSFWNGVKATAERLLGQLVHTVSSKIQEAQKWFTDMPGKIKDAFAGTGDLLTEAGRKIIGGFVDGLKSAWESGKEFIGGIGGWIQANKGPISYDKRLLIPAGQAIMKGLTGGLQDGMPSLQSQVRDITSAVSLSSSTGVRDAHAAGQSIAGAFGAGLHKAAPDPLTASMTGQADVVQSLRVDPAAGLALGGDDVPGVAGGSAEERAAAIFADALAGVNVVLDSRATIGHLGASRAGKRVFAS